MAAIMPSKPTQGWRIVMIRHVHHAKARDAWHALEAVDVGRKHVVSYAPPVDEVWPPGPWFAYVRFAGEPWVYILPSSPNLVSVERLGAAKELNVIGASFDPSDGGATRLCFYKRGKLAVEFAARGGADDPLRVEHFRSTEHRKTFLDAFDTAGAAVADLLTSLKATPRRLTARRSCGKWWVGFEDGPELTSGDWGQYGAQHFVPLATGESPASDRLVAAIESGDVAGVRRAIAEGASLEFHPDRPGSPLGYASLYPDRPNYLAVCGALVDAGAPLGGHDWENPVFLGAMSPFRDEHSELQLLGAILTLGADVSAPGRTGRRDTPLHEAVFRKKLAVTKFLVSRGARLDVRNADGRTPREWAEWLAGGLAGDDRRRDIAEFLRAAEEGSPDVGDIASLAEVARVERVVSRARGRQLLDALKSALSDDVPPPEKP